MIRAKILIFFTAATSDGNNGIYVYDPYLNAYADLADTTMTAPTGGTFASFSNISSGGGELGFLATDSNGVQGLYVQGVFSPLPTLIATPTSSPQAGVTFGNLQSISIDGTPYGEQGGEIESDAGIYDFQYNAGSPTAFTFVGDTNTTPPGASGPFTSFGPVSYKGMLFESNVPGVADTLRAVRAIAGGVQGIYYGSQIQFVRVPTPAPLMKLAEVGDPVPALTGALFTSFGNPIATANEILFTAHYNTADGDQQGIFAFGPYEDLPLPPFTPPAVHEIVATGQTAPNSGGATFTNFSSLSDTSFDETFMASLSNGQQGLFVDVQWGSSVYDQFVSTPPQIVKVVETGDILDGKTVSDIQLAPNSSNTYDLSEFTTGYSNVGVGFEVNFTDGSEGLYYFLINDIPEPALISFLPLSMLLIRRRK